MDLSLYAVAGTTKPVELGQRRCGGGGFGWRGRKGRSGQIQQRVHKRSSQARQPLHPLCTQGSAVGKRARGERRLPPVMRRAGKSVVGACSYASSEQVQTRRDRRPGSPHPPFLQTSPQERMQQRLLRRDPLSRVERETPVDQVDERRQKLELVVLHP